MIKYLRCRRRGIPEGVGNPGFGHRRTTGSDGEFRAVEHEPEASLPARTRLRHRRDGCAPGPLAQVRPSRTAVQLHSAITKSDPESSSCAAKD